MFRLIGRFFDRALCYTAEAYEREASREDAEAKSRQETDHRGTPIYSRLRIH